MKQVSGTPVAQRCFGKQLQGFTETIPSFSPGRKGDTFTPSAADDFRISFQICICVIHSRLMTRCCLSGVLVTTTTPKKNSHFLFPTEINKLKRDYPQISLIANHKARKHHCIRLCWHHWAACNLICNRWNCFVGIPSLNTNFPFSPNKHSIAGCSSVFPAPRLETQWVPDITKTVNRRQSIKKLPETISEVYSVRSGLWHHSF